MGLGACVFVCVCVCVCVWVWIDAVLSDLVTNMHFCLVCLHCKVLLYISSTGLFAMSVENFTRGIIE